VVKAALSHNAAAVVFAHNHPSGVAEPSHADEILTRNLKQSLALVEVKVKVKVLDHFIVGGSQAMSFAERGCCKSLFCSLQIGGFPQKSLIFNGLFM
jgi:DNA repair protein RadC